MLPRLGQAPEGQGAHRSGVTDGHVATRGNLMQGDMPAGGFSADELARLEAAGIIEMVQPGTPEAAALDQQLLDELEVADAELLVLEGPDAFTSTRMLR